MHGRLLLFPRRRKDYTPAGSNAGSDTGLPMMDWLPTRERGRGTFYDSSFPTVDRLSVRFWWLRSPEKKNRLLHLSFDPHVDVVYGAFPRHWHVLDTRFVTQLLSQRVGAQDICVINYQGSKVISNSRSCAPRTQVFVMPFVDLMLTHPVITQTTPNGNTHHGILVIEEPALGQETWGLVERHCGKTHAFRCELQNNVDQRATNMSTAAILKKADATSGSVAHGHRETE